MESRINIASRERDTEESTGPAEPDLRDFGTASDWPLDSIDLITDFGLGWVVVDNDGVIVQINKICLDVLGISPAQSVPIRFDDYLAPEFLELVNERRQRRLKGEDVPNDYECRVISPDGKELWVRLLLSVVERAGKPFGTKAIIINITEQKAAEREMQLQEQRYAELINNIQCGVVNSDLDGNVKACNDQFLNFLGRSKNEIGSLNLKQVIAPEHLADVNRRLALRLVGDTEPYVGESRCFHADGHDVWLQVRSTPWVENGQLLGNRSLVLDVTKQKNAELEAARQASLAHQSAQTQKAIIKSLPANILLTDENGTILSVSESWQQLTDENDWTQKLEFKVGQNFLELCSRVKNKRQNSAMAIHDGLSQVLNLEVPYFEHEGEYDLAGEIRWFNFAATPLVPGQYKGAVILHQDTTRQRLVFESLKQTKMHLNDLVNTTGGILWEADARTLRFAYVSEAAERILGYPVEMWTKDVDFWASHIHPEDRKSAIEYCMHSTSRGETHQFKYRMFAADGRIVWLEAGVNVVMKDGRPDTLRGVMLDITEQMEQQQTLANLSTTLDLSFSEIYIFDADSLRFMYVNNGATRNLGFTTKQLLEMTPLDLKPEFNEHSFKKLLEPLISGDKTQLAFTTKHLRADGSTYPAEIHLYNTSHDSKPSYLAVVLDITERRKNEEFHQLLLQNVKSGLILVDRDGVITLANRFVSQMFGYGEKELVGKSIECLVPKHQRAEHKAQRLEFMKDIKSIHMGTRPDLSGLRKDGKEFPVDIEVSPVKIAGVPYLMAGINDLTDRIEIEREAEKIREKYQRVVEHMHDALIVDDLQGQVVYCNDRFLEYFGLNREDIGDFAIADYVSPEYLPEVLDNHQRRISRKYVPDIQEFEGVRKDGSRLWLQARTTLVIKDEQVFGTQSILLDITESRAIEAALHRTQLHVQELVNNTPGIVWESRPGTLQFSYVSKQAERLLGYPVERWLNEPNFWRDHIHTYDRDMVVREYGNDSIRDESHRIEYRMIAADGSVVWLDDQITVIYEDGKPVLLRGIMVDISERKNLMEALRNLSQREGAQVENERRRIAQELHDDYSQRLAFVALRLQALGQELPDGSNAQQMTISDLWTETKLLSTDLHNLAYELAPTSLRKLGLQGAISNLCDKYYKLHALPVDFIFKDLPEHLSDSKAIALYRIVQEALNNVRKHSNAEDALVRLSGRDGNLELVISDSGEGFDTTRGDYMHNLGLMGMAERAYMVGGTWSINSHPDSGTEIKVVVPLPVLSISPDDAKARRDKDSHV